MANDNGRRQNMTITLPYNLLNYTPRFSQVHYYYLLIIQ